MRAKGELATAQEILTEALQLAFVVGPRLTVVTAMEALASVTVEHGEVVLTVRMLSAASTLRAQMGTPLRPIDQAPFEKALESARSKIAPEDFSVAWSEAETMPLEQIVGIMDWSAEPR